MTFDEYYYKNFDLIFNYIYKRNFDYELSLDIVQETFLRVFLKFDKLMSMDEKAAKCYLYKATNSVIIDFSRKKKTSSLNYDSAEEGSSQNLEISLDAKFLQQRIKKLPTIYQEALMLKYVEELENHEISKVLNKKESSVRSLIKRGIEKLQIDNGMISI